MLDEGARFFVFHYCISFFLFSLHGTSRAFIVRPGEPCVLAGIPYTVATLLLGWWSLEGPLLTVSALKKNFSGGSNITSFVAAKMGDPLRGAGTT